MFDKYYRNKKEQIRSLDTLHPVFRERLDKFLDACEKAGFNVLVYETFRFYERQYWYYQHGRVTGIGVPGRPITWTLNSMHRYGLAADMCPLDRNNGLDYDLLTPMMLKMNPEKYGLELLKNDQGRVIEWPHLQIKDAQKVIKEFNIKPDIIVGSTNKPLSIIKPTEKPIKINMKIYVNGVEVSNKETFNHGISKTRLIVNELEDTVFIYAKSVTADEIGKPNPDINTGKKVMVNDINATGKIIDSKYIRINCENPDKVFIVLKGEGWNG